MKYMTQNGLNAARIIHHIKAEDNQPVVVVLTDIETGLEDVYTYTNDLKFHSDRSESGLNLVEVLPEYKVTSKFMDELEALRNGGVL
jgi:hypothetical protein